MYEKNKITLQNQYDIFIKQESSSLIAIRVPRILKALRPLEGLVNLVVIKEPFTNPKSNNLLLILPITV